MFKVALEFFLLREEERAAARRSSAAQEAVDVHYDASVRRARGARSAPYGAVALILHREAALQLLLAIAADRGVTLDAPTLAGAWKEMIPRIDTPRPPDFAIAEAALFPSDPLAADHMPRRELVEAVRAVEHTMDWLNAELRPRARSRVRRMRVVRILGGLLAAAFVIHRVGGCVLAPRNIARGRPVVVSSSAYKPVDPSGLTNGTLDQPYGAATGPQEKPWIQIDLGRTRTLGTVRIFNRLDGAPDASLPLALELSTDGVNFVEVARCVDPFTHAKPCVLRLAKRYARQVRLVVPRYAQLALTEVEINADD